MQLPHNAAAMLLAFSQTNEQFRSHRTPYVKLHGSSIPNSLKRDGRASLSRWTAGQSGSSASWAQLGNRKEPATGGCHVDGALVDSPGWEKPHPTV